MCNKEMRTSSDYAVEEIQARLQEMKTNYSFSSLTLKSV